MKININKNQFSNLFSKCNRGNNFSYEARDALYDYLYNNYGDDYVVDIIAICCDFREDEQDDILSDYDVTSLDELSEVVNIVAVLDDSIIIQD